MSLFKVQSLFEAIDETTVIQHRRLKTPWFTKNLDPKNYTLSDITLAGQGFQDITVSMWRDDLANLLLDIKLLGSLNDAHNAYMKEVGNV